MYWLLENPEYTKYFSENFTFVYDDRIHGIIFRLETVVPVLFVVGLYGSRIVDECYDDISIFCGSLLLDQNLIAVKDACVNHTLALDLEHKGLLVRHIFRRNWKISFDVLLSEDRLSGSDCADDRHIDHLTADHVERFVEDLDRAWLGRVAANISVALQGFEMGVNGGSGF